MRNAGVFAGNVITGNDPSEAHLFQPETLLADDDNKRTVYLNIPLHYDIKDQVTNFCFINLCAVL